MFVDDAARNGLHYSKFFTYVTKTCTSLSTIHITYIRMLGNYTIIFEIDIMKESSPINQNLYQNWLFLICFGCLICFLLHWKLLRAIADCKEKKWHFVFDEGQWGFLNSSQKIMMPLWFSSFLLYVDKFGRVLVT